MDEKKKWVQHISGQGEKWEVTKDKQPMLCWRVKLKDDRAIYYGLFPRSEYHLCDSPEQWENVTKCYKPYVGKECDEISLLYNEKFTYVDDVLIGDYLIIERRKE